MNRREELEAIFKDIDSNLKSLVDKTIEDVVYIEERMDYLRGLPDIRVHPKDNTKQEYTKAFKMYHEYSSMHDNKIRILCSLLHKSDGEEIDPVAMFMGNAK